MLRILLLIVTLSSCTTYTGVVTVKGCCPTCLELQVGEYHYVRPGNTLEWFDSLNVGDTAIIDRHTLRILNRL